MHTHHTVFYVEKSRRRQQQTEKVAISNLVFTFFFQAPQARAANCMVFVYAGTTPLDLHRSIKFTLGILFTRFESHPLAGPIFHYLKASKNSRVTTFIRQIYTRSTIYILSLMMKNSNLSPKMSLLFFKVFSFMIYTLLHALKYFLSILLSQSILASFSAFVKLCGIQQREQIFFTVKYSSNILYVLVELMSKVASILQYVT